MEVKHKEVIKELLSNQHHYEYKQVGSEIIYTKISLSDYLINQIENNIDIHMNQKNIFYNTILSKSGNQYRTELNSLIDILNNVKKVGKDNELDAWNFSIDKSTKDKQLIKDLHILISSVPTGFKEELEEIFGRLINHYILLWDYYDVLRTYKLKPKYFQDEDMVDEYSNIFNQKYK